MARNSITCPVCGESFRRAQSSRGITSFNCPGCDVDLEYESTGMDFLLGAVSLFGGPLISYYLGYRGLTFVVVSIGAGLLFLALGVVITFHVRPPNAQRKLNYGETGLSLTGKSVRREDPPPKG